MHGYVPCPDVYAKHLLESTEFFLERATSVNEIISEQRPEGHLSPFASPLLPAATGWQEIPAVSLDVSLPRLLCGLKPLLVGGFFSRLPRRAAQALQVKKSTARSPLPRKGTRTPR